MNEPRYLQTDRANEAAELVNRLLPRIDSLEAKERQFVEDMESRVDEYGEKAFVSVKQVGWLRDLDQRVSQ